MTRRFLSRVGNKKLFIQHHHSVSEYFNDIFQVVKTSITYPGVYIYIYIYKLYPDWNINILYMIKSFLDSHTYNIYIYIYIYVDSTTLSLKGFFVSNAGNKILAHMLQLLVEVQLQMMPDAPKNK